MSSSSEHVIVIHDSGDPFATAKVVARMLAPRPRPVWWRRLIQRGLHGR